MAGGTGGHVFPALAVAQALRAREVSVSWLGTRRGIEAELVPAHDLPINYIDVAGLRGKGLVKLLWAPLLLVRALWQALAVLRRERPDAVLGLGGFASGPGGLAARLLGIPLVIHEQNAIAGTTNKLLGKMANRILEAFPGALPRGEWTGNPVRPEIGALPEPRQRIAPADRPRHLLVLGGSLGALAINQLLPEALALLPEAGRPQVIHQCGRAHQQVTEEAYQQAGVEAQVEPFIADMAAAYGWADLVICRSGALTVSELAAAGVASILIPFPFAIDDHQTHNGQWLVDGGAAELIQQNELSAEKLAGRLTRWLSDGERLKTMAENARKLAKPHVAERVADICEEVCGGR
ncbi:MAG: undecaprenyldiphospho-muramoylpentapeptide beta-N-acetylglucosaminyltransferase [Gammaproteobacteria bacterium]|nr:MAG: undecaprenyldiphospho-muramoylpentapeptide beta-N-acetylglucosaminyltransferase [Gammaproteobacteria bacterium]